MECQRLDTWARNGWIGEAEGEPLGRCQGGKRGATSRQLSVFCP